MRVPPRRPLIPALRRALTGMIMTTTQIPQAPRFVLSGDCSAAVQGDTVVFRLHRLENIASEPLAPVVQLWACPAVPENDGAQGTLLGQHELPPLENGEAHAEVSVEALVEGSVAGTVQLVLAVARRESPACWEDQRLLGPATFSQPQLCDPVAFEIGPRGTEVQLAGYASPRATGNLSGSLSLELWAQPQPFTVDPPEGHCLGQLLQGIVHGGEQREAMRLRYLAAELPEGWHTFALLLREWNGERYLTRDFRNAAEAICWPLEGLRTVPAVAGLTANTPAGAMATRRSAAREEGSPPDALPDASSSAHPASYAAPPEAVEPVIAPEAARAIEAEAASLHAEVAAAPADADQDEPTGKLSFWRRFARLFSKP